MHRRSFLKWQIQGALLATAGGILLPDSHAGVVTDTHHPGDSTTQVAPPHERLHIFSGWPHVAVCRGTPAKAVRGAVDALGGMARFVRAGQRVLIKPNMSFASGPDTGMTTNPDVVLEVVRLCLEAGAEKVEVADHPLQHPHESLLASGILEACNSVAPDICHQYTAPRFFSHSEMPHALEMSSNSILRAALEAHVIIAVPVAKSHSGTGVSLSLKGQMGLVLDRQSMHSRYHLAHAIVDLNTRLMPHLTIIDATTILLTGGPAGPGTVITPHEIIASHDAVAADAVAVGEYQWNDRVYKPADIEHIRLAHERGLGRMDVENLVVHRSRVHSS